MDGERKYGDEKLILKKENISILSYSNVLDVFVYELI